MCFWHSLKCLLFISLQPGQYTWRDLFEPVFSQLETTMKKHPQNVILFKMVQSAGQEKCIPVEQPKTFVVSKMPHQQLQAMEHFS